MWLNVEVAAHRRGGFPRRRHLLPRASAVRTARGPARAIAEISRLARESMNQRRASIHAASRCIAPREVDPERSHRLTSGA